MPFDRVTGLLLSLYPLLRAVTLFHIENIRSVRHYLAPRRSWDSHPWSPLWLRLNQQRLELLANVFQKPKVR